VAVIQGQIILD